MTRLFVPPWQVAIVLTIGVFSVSSAAIWVRLAIAAADSASIGFSLFLAASRLIIASLIVLPAWRGIRAVCVPRRGYHLAILAGIALGLHFAAWITSLSLTSIAASTVLVTTSPLWVVLLSWLCLGEKPTPLTVAGIAIAFSGGILVALTAGNSAGIQDNPLLGNTLALLGAIMASFYLICGREAQRLGLTTSAYIAIAYGSAAILLLPLPGLMGTSYWGFNGKVYIYLGLLALIPQVIGHTSFNWAVRWLSPTVVTLAILGEPIGSSLLGWLIFAEIPSLWVGLGGLLVLTGVAIAATQLKEKI
ncbi:MAG: DMT family transporter [Chloroflexaceae bacterium]|nr:DMT family transporter [Chloroflexaceae bacterium]